MIIRDIVFTFFFLLILYGCKNDDVPMYFRSMQPSGGKLFKGSIKDYYINSLPQNLYIGSKDYAIDSTYSAEQKEYEMVKYLFNLGLLGTELHMIMIAALIDPITKGADLGVQISRNTNNVELNIHFDQDKKIIESFKLDNLFPDSIFSKKGVALSKENIISFNAESNNGFYNIGEIWEIDRSNGGINIYENPFYAGMPGKRINFFDDKRISNTPLESFDKQLGNMKQSFNLQAVDFNDSLKTYSADPGYMAFRNALDQKSYDFNNKLLFVYRIYEACSDRMESDTLKYGALLDYLSTYSLITSE